LIESPISLILAGVISIKAFAMERLPRGWSRWDISFGLTNREILGQSVSSDPELYVTGFAAGYSYDSVSAHETSSVSLGCGVAEADDDRLPS